jgi:transcriptional regulator with XRE-family HTH domain
MFDSDMFAVPRFTVSDRLRRARRSAGLSETVFAELLGMDQKTIRAFERSDEVPPAAVLKLWSAQTGVPAKWLQYGTINEEQIALIGKPAPRRPVSATGGRLRKARDAIGEDTVGFAGIMGVSVPDIRRAERGTAPSQSMFRNWAERTGISVDWLMSGMIPEEYHKPLPVQKKQKPLPVIPAPRPVILERRRKPSSYS